MSAIAGLGPKKSPYTPLFTFLRGEYRLGLEKLPYFGIVIPFRDAKRYLALARDIIFDPKEPIPLKELIQRELDDKRVVSEIVPYLKKPHDIKLFNALTVALLPTSAPPGSRICDSFADTVEEDPPVQDVDQQLDVTQIGGVQLQVLRNNTSVGHVRWNTDLVRPVILDGQHRFAALQELSDDPTTPYKQNLDETEIPVLLLILAKEAGFLALPLQAYGAPAVRSLLTSISML